MTPVAAAVLAVLAASLAPRSAAQLPWARPPGCDPSTCSGCTEYRISTDNFTLDSGGSTQLPENPCGGDSAYFPGRSTVPAAEPPWFARSVLSGRIVVPSHCTSAMPACSANRVFCQLRGMVPLRVALRGLLRRRLRSWSLPVAWRRRIQRHTRLQLLHGGRSAPDPRRAGHNLPLLLPQPQMRGR